MKCPKCGTTEDIKFFLRHQDEDKNDDNDVANVITIICTKCGENQSYFLKDCLSEIFPSWEETPNFNMDMIESMLENNFSEGLTTEER